ncbi:MAG: hypothetical protein AAGI38_16670 [Bacteroidota bacterium]
MRTQFRIILLPRYFRIIGIIVLVIGLVPPIALKKLEIIHIEQEVTRTYVEVLILACLIMIAFTKDKVEDELTTRTRLESFYLAFFMGMGTTILEPFIKLMTSGNFTIETSTFGVLFNMMIFYFLGFFLLNREP